jgi:hypothetical protein
VKRGEKEKREKGDGRREKEKIEMMILIFYKPITYSP